MIAIPKKFFRPRREEEAGLKDDIFFRVTDLELPEEKQQKFKRLSVQELIEKNQQGAQIFIETATVPPGAETLTGKEGLVQATTSQIQQQIEEGRENTERKRQETSSLVLLERDTGPDSEFRQVRSARFAKKGEVLDIQDEQSGLPYLFIGRNSFTKVNQTFGNRVEVSNLEIFPENSKFLTIINADVAGLNKKLRESGREDLVDKIRSVYFFEIDEIVNASSPPEVITSSLVKDQYTTKNPGENNNVVFSPKTGIDGEQVRIVLEATGDQASKVNVSKETQQVSFDVTPTAGTYSLVHSERTLPIIPDDGPQTIQQYLNSLRSLSGIEVTGDYANDFTVTFTGNSGGKNHLPLSAVSNNLTAEVEITGTPTVVQEGSGSQDEIQRLDFSEVPTSGIFRLKFSGEETQALPAEETNAALIQQELRALSNLSDVDVSGNFSLGFVITFAGSDGLQDQPLLEFIQGEEPLSTTKDVKISVNTVTQGSVSIDEVQKITFSDTPTSGGFRLLYREKTDPIAHDDDLSIIESKIEGLAGIEDIELEESDTFDIVFQSEFNIEKLQATDSTLSSTVDVISTVSVLQQGSSTQNEKQRIVFDKVPTAGTYKIQLSENQTGTLNYNATSSDIQNALNVFTSVSVTGSASSGFDIEFGKDDFQTLQIVESTLEATVPVKVSIKTLQQGAQINIKIPRSESLSAERLINLVNNDPEASTLVSVSLPEGETGSGLIFPPSVSNIKLNPTIFSPITEDGTLLKEEERDIIEEFPVFYAIPGTPVLRGDGVKGNSLEKFASLIRQEIPSTNMFAPVGQPVETDPRFVGNLDLSSLNVALHDDDSTSLLIEKGEAKAGVSVQYELHTESTIIQAENPTGGDQEEKIEAGTVDVTISLSAFPARLPIRGSLISGGQILPLGVRIASTPGRVKDIDSFDEISSGDTVRGREQPNEAPSEFYFNLQAQGTGGAVNLNKYGTFRIFDEIEIKQQESGKTELTTLQRNTIVGVDEENNAIFLKDPINVSRAVLDPAATILVEVPQSPLQPGRNYRLTVTALDRDGAPETSTTAKNRQQIQPPGFSTRVAGTAANSLPPENGVSKSVPVSSSTPGVSEVIQPGKIAVDTDTST